MNYLVAIPLFCATVAWLGFITWYWLRAKWWKHIVGRNTMSVSFVLFFILFRLSFLQLESHLTEGSSWDLTARGAVTGALLYSFAAFLAVQRLYIMERAQREEYHVEEEDVDPTLKD